MKRMELGFEELTARSLALFDRQWALLSAGEYQTGRFNSMTISWGSIGTMWNRPFVQVVVRGTRYTYGFIEEYDTFTVSWFPEEYRSALQLLGTKSGRDGDKIAESGLTPVPAVGVAAPGFKEAELVLSCRKIFFEDMKPERFLDSAIGRHYPEKDYHRMYFGEVLAVEGTHAYKSIR